MAEFQQVLTYNDKFYIFLESGIFKGLFHKVLSVSVFYSLPRFPAPRGERSGARMQTSRNLSQLNVQ